MEFARTLFVVAVAGEVKPLLERTGAREAVESFGGPGWPAVELPGASALVISGIGRANAAGATAWMLARQPAFSRVINLGVAGALPAGGLRLGEIVIATESVFVEEGVDLPEGHADVNALGFPLGDDEWAEGNRIFPDSTLTESIERVGADALADPASAWRRGIIATVAQCSGADRAAREIERRTGAIAEAMEGAAVVATARRLGVPAAEIRAISNTCGDRDAQQWDFKRAVRAMDRVVTVLIECAANAAPAGRDGGESDSNRMAH